MYLIPATLTLFISVCVSRVPLNGRTSLDSGGQSTRVLPGNLSIPSNAAAISPTGGSLGFPIHPGMLDFGIIFNFEPAPGAPAWRSTFEGGELLSSIFFQLLKTWKDLSNAPITQEIDVRDGPFDIRYTIRPAPAGQTSKVTPQRIGLVYRQMMNEVLQQQHWPGHITAEMITAGPDDVRFGTIVVKDRLANPRVSSLSNSPPGHQPILTAGNGTLSITTSNTTHAQISPLLQTRAEREKAWLQTFSILALDIVEGPASMRFSRADWPTSASDYWSIPFSAPGAEWELILKISFLAIDVVTRESVAAAMMQLILAAATQDVWDFGEKVALHDADRGDLIIIYFQRLGNAAAS